LPLQTNPEAQLIPAILNSDLILKFSIKRFLNL
jgi:hypothetical protein